MRIYISCAPEDLPRARELAELVAHHPSVASASATTIYNPLDDPALSGKNERDVEAMRQAKLAESDLIIFFLSQAAMSSSEVWFDIEQARLLRAAGAVKIFLTVPLSPFDFDEPLSSFHSVNGVRRRIEDIAIDVAYYTTWRPREIGGKIAFQPPYSPQPVRHDGDTYLEPMSPPLPQPALPQAPIAPGAMPADAPAPIRAPVLPAQVPPPVQAPPSGQASQAQPFPPLSPAPRRKEDRESAATRAAPLSTATLQFSAYHPNAMPVETWDTLLVYTYIAEALAEVQADAGTFTELGSAPTVVEGQSTRAVARGVELTIEPHVEGVTFSPTSDTFVWRDDWRRSLFRFSGAATLAGTEQSGWIDIYAHPMVPIARIDVNFRFHETRLERLATSHPRGMIITSNIYDSVFISYSHRDTEAFRQACDEYRRFGITIYTDEQIEAGVQFEHELSQMIAAAKVFHLLWSGHSAASHECRKEWLSALQREPTERFIKPWFWKQPLAPPPSEFSQYRISFKYEPLKRSLWRPSTWFQ
jgi:TIR domain